jgi:hypothetical protein
VYRQKEPATLVRIVGRAPLEATVFAMERLRCNACLQMFTAGKPEDVGPGKFDAAATATVALLKYSTGMPFNRLARLERQMGIPLPAATQWELDAGAKVISPALNHLIRQAAQGGVMHNDDTGMRILKLPREPGDSRATNVRAHSRAASFQSAADGRSHCTSPVRNTPAKTLLNC